MRAIDATRLYFDRAADQMDLSENMRQLLLTAKREVPVQIAVELDNGEIATLIGYRVQHDDARGPMKGGLALSSRGRLDEVRSLAALMTWKTAVVDIPLRRRQGGHRRRSREAQPPRAGADHAQVHRRHSRRDRTRHRHSGPRHGHQRRGDGLDHEPVREVPRLQSRRASPASRSSCTAFPGAKKRPAAASASWRSSCLSRLGRKPQQTRVALQGFGNVGSHAAKFLSEAECKVVAVSDVSGGYYRPEGLDIPKMLQYAREHQGFAAGLHRGRADHERRSCWSWTSTC